jgi:hypothetical protein
MDSMVRRTSRRCWGALGSGLPRGPCSVVREREKAIGWISEGSREARTAKRHARLAACARAWMWGLEARRTARDRQPEPMAEAVRPRARRRGGGGGRACRWLACVRGTLATADEPGPYEQSRTGWKAAGGVTGDEACLETPRPRPVAPAGSLHRRCGEISRDACICIACRSAGGASVVSGDLIRPERRRVRRFNCRWW